MIVGQGFTTLDVARSIADGLDGDYDDGLEVHLGAGAVVAETGRIVLTVITSGEDGDREFRFLGGEVTP